MSRGPGKWQRGILAALEAHPAVFLNDLLPSDRRHAEYSALHRAAWRLYREGRIQIMRHGLRVGPEPDLALLRPGIPMPDWAEIPRLKVEGVRS